MKNIIFILPVLFLQLSYACPIGSGTVTPERLKQLKNEGQNARSRRQVSSTVSLPDTTTEKPWGGKDSSKWKPEAILANASTFWLNRGWSEKNVADVLVSTPVKMVTTKDHVYGDGQTNATLNFGSGWKYDHPQLVATLVKYKNGDRKVNFNFSPNIKNISKIYVTSFVKDGQGKEIKLKSELKVKRIKKAVLAQWLVPKNVEFGNDFISRVTWVQIDGWNTSFPIDFRMAIHSNQELIDLSKNTKTLNNNPLDPIKVFERSKANNETAQRTLVNGIYGDEWFRDSSSGSVMLSNSSVHAQANGAVTAVGGGLTWFLEKGKHSSFKNLYTCFEPRNFEKESEFGVPSGGGWHEIGDAAETIINNLESEAVIVGSAVGLPWPTPPDTGAFSWDLKDVVTVRLLQPGEALMTGAGDQTWKEDIKWRSKRDDSDRGLESSGGGRNYHWFLFHSNQPTCTQEWVHNCIPNAENDLGLNEKKSDPTKCH